MTFSLWDILLVVVVTGQAAWLAYTYAPKWKALIYCLPVPFTFATLALGERVNATNVLGLTLMLGYTHAVRVLYTRCGVPVIGAIVLSAVGYCLVATWCAPRVPKTEAAFWLASVGTMLLAFGLYKVTPHREEPGHRSPLPLWIKIPIMAGVVVVLVMIKNSMQGFMTMFPMVGVITSYEARRSLWTICRAIPVFMVASTPFMATSHVLSPHVGLAGSLVAGWVVFLSIILPLTYSMWSADAKKISEVAGETTV